VRYVGEPIVGVIAQSRYQAEDALEFVDIKYDLLPVVVDPETGRAGRCATVARGRRH